MHETNPANGLVPDSTKQRTAASIAAVGLGLTAYPISVERGFVIESVNADLRTYLGRLKRRSRCFSRCINALRRAIRLLVWHYNRRQRAIANNPRLKGNLSL